MIPSLPATAMPQARTHLREGLAEPAPARVARLLVITDTAILGPGGSERFLRNLITGLSPDQYHIDVVQLIAPPLTSACTVELASRPGLSIQYLPVGAIYGPRAARVYLKLCARILRGHYDLVQSQHEKADLLCALLPRGPARALRISNRRDTGFQKNARLRLAFRALNPRFDWVIAPSRAVLDQLGKDEGLGTARLRCLPNGVDSDHFRPLDFVQRERRREELGIAPGHFVFACVARLVPVKRHQDLITALAQLNDPRARLLLIGGGPQRQTLEDQAQAAGISEQIEFLGERSDIERLLPAADAFVLCSQTEGSSNAVLEAMACGLPVIATAVGGNPEAVEDGVSGTLVAPGSPDQLASAMRALLADPQRARVCGRAGRGRVESAFSIQAMVALYDQLYRECRDPELSP